MKLWLVRHAQPLIAPGICYGASDVAAEPMATQQAAQALVQTLPIGICVTSSPLQRCEQLELSLRELRPDLTYKTDTRLQELDFGCWEGQRWDDIARHELDQWAANFGHWRCGGAESVQDIMARVADMLDEARFAGEDAVWITHAGVIRATMLLSRGVREVTRVDQWPSQSIAFGQATTLLV